MKTNFDRTCRTGAKTRDGKLEQQPGDNFLQMKDNEKGHSVWFLEDLFSQVTLMLSLQIAAPGYLVVKFVIVLH